MEKTPAQSVIELLAYQRESFRDRSWITVDCWSRQAGKDFTSSCAAVDRSMEDHRAWYIIATTQGQADETHDKCRFVADVFKQTYRLSGRITGSDSAEYVDYDPEIDEAFKCVARTLHLPGGGKVISMPGRNADSVAGKTGNIILTEFALFAGGGYNHWRVIFPLTTRGYFVRAISTPRGKNTKFSELRNKGGRGVSVRNVDVYRAVADGLQLKDPNGSPISIEDLRDLYGDPVGWEREYELKESGDLEALVKWAQLTAASSEGDARPFKLVEISDDSGYAAGELAAHLKAVAAACGRLEIGWDVARHSHLSSLWINYAATPTWPRSLAALVLMRRTTFALQRDIIREVFASVPGSVGIGDSTGLGMDSNETLSHLWPNRWSGLNFTGAAKRDLGSVLMTAYDDGGQLLPSMDRYKFIATDVYAVQKEGDASNLKLSESENPLLRESHCDIAYSNALALKAAQTPWQRGHLWTA
ncbi:MAG: hypothetical protein BWX88_02682 [Planctomycetes bacterium ADurb.Bin126]|nr:MAG: hypothetical protein BWX88_02682 [Planctomycetes bacterium ADurb.Bin126]HOD79966.1 hypothetical protein [Phycisphaerae bacterium]HQL74023.1 hypothetical protein [Phycisphaerae bacterium]